MGYLLHTPGTSPVAHTLDANRPDVAVMVLCFLQLTFNRRRNGGVPSVETQPNSGRPVIRHSTVYHLQTLRQRIQQIRASFEDTDT